MSIDPNRPNIYTTENDGSPIRAVFLNVIQPRAVKRNGKDVGNPRFDILAVLEPDSANALAIKDLAVSIARAEWPGRPIGAQSKTGDFVFPFSDGTKEADRAKAKGKDMEIARGKVVIKAKSKFRPGLAYVANGALVDLFGDEQAIAKAASKFYRGVEIGLELAFVANAGTDTIPDGVSAYLNRVISLNKGDRLQGQGRTSAEAFKGYAGKVTDEDPTAGMDLDDDIPF